MKNILLGFLLIIGAQCFEHCSNEVKSTFDEVIKVDYMKIKEKDSRHLELSFQGTALFDTKELVANIGVSVLGISIQSETFAYCHNLDINKRKGWLRTSSDEVPDCSFKRGDVVSGAFVVSIDEAFLAGMNFDYTLKLSDGKRETCIADERVMFQSFRTSASGRRFSFSEKELDKLWNLWIQEHQGNLYLPPRLDTDTNSLQSTQTSQILERKKIFEENLVRIAIHNANDRNTAKLGMNHFGHLSNEEFKRYFASGTKVNESTRRSSKVLKVDPYKKMPAEVNWVKKGAVTPVKNQGGCGSCWSFAATGALEGAYFLSTGNLVSFSEQELVSCDHVDKGCNGGAMDNAWVFAELNNGLCAESSFPYTSGTTGFNGYCDTPCAPIPGSIPKEIVDIPQDKTALEQAVAQQPVAVAINGNSFAFQFYTSGVLTAECTNDLDHGVLAVGYGYDVDQEVDYWLVKNSWGPSWGIEGYVKMERGLETIYGGECGILLGASFPEL